MRVCELWWCTSGDVVPVGGQEVVFACLDEFKQFGLITVWRAERRETAQQNVRDHTNSPHVHFKTVACNNHIMKCVDLKAPSLNQTSGLYHFNNIQT